MVLHDDERMAGVSQTMEQRDQAGDVFAVQAGRWFIEQQQGAGLTWVEATEVADEFEALGFAAGKCGQRLSE